MLSDMEWVKVKVKKNRFNFFSLFIIGLVMFATGLLFLSETVAIYFITRNNDLYIPCYLICILSLGIMFIGMVVMYRVLKGRNAGPGQVEKKNK